MRNVLLHPSFINLTSSEMLDRSETFAKVVEGDVDGLIEAAKHYGESWYQREGAGAFFMLARKWDRIEKRMKDEGYKSMIEVLKADRRAEGMIDDLRDLRRYLVLVEAKLIELGVIHEEVAKGDSHTTIERVIPELQCGECGIKYKYGVDGALCPHAPLEKTEQCAVCRAIFKFGIPCPNCNILPR